MPAHGDEEQSGLPPEILLLRVTASMLMVSSVLLILLSLRG